MKQISGGRMRRGQAAVALCVAVAALSLLVSLVALWRSHAAMYDAEQALRAGGATPGLQAALEQVLTATDPGEPTMRVEPTDEPSPRAEPVASEPAEGAALAANGQAILAQGDDAASTAVVAPPAHRWDGPTVPAVPAGTVVPWDEARGHFSRTITVEGKVVETGAGRSGQPVYLNFSPFEPGTDDFYIAVFRDGFANAPDGDPRNYYEGKTIRVTGEVSQYRDRPQMRVEGPGMIEVVE